MGQGLKEKDEEGSWVSPGQSSLVKQSGGRGEREEALRKKKKSRLTKVQSNRILLRCIIMNAMSSSNGFQSQAFRGIMEFIMSVSRIYVSVPFQLLFHSLRDTLTSRE